MKPQTIVSKLIKQLCRDIHEREQIMAVCLLGAIAGHNTFLFGPPGTAKSLISRRLAGAFESSEYFEYLMNRFSTPEEVFGPVSLKALKENRYTRKVEGYLPTANFAFLDEIWKASPAILNNLLTIINEHIFKNGDERINVPLKSLIAASNEVPAKNQGLEALYDRFIIRLFVPPIQHDNHFKTLLDSQPTNEKTEIDAELRISQAQLEQWRKQLHQVRISEDTFQIIQYIRKELAKRFKELDVYVSDRRWQRAAVLLKASAFCNGRTETNHSDAVLLKYCLWTTPENRESIEKLVIRSIKTCGFKTLTNLTELDFEKETLDKEIQKELYHSRDVYKTVKLKNKHHFYIENIIFKPKHSSWYSEKRFSSIYIPQDKQKTKTTFHPIDENGNIFSQIECMFDSQGSCKLSYSSEFNEITYTPEILINKGDKKDDVNIRLIEALIQSTIEIRNKLNKTLIDIENKYQNYQNHLSSPFVTQADADVAVSGILEQINQLKLRIKDCERLEALCH